MGWRDQLYGAAFLLAGLPLLNGLTTNSHLLMAVPKGQWAIARRRFDRACDRCLTWLDCATRRTKGVIALEKRRHVIEDELTVRLVHRGSEKAAP